MEIYFQYVKLRKQFGRHAKFTEEGAEMIADIRPNEVHAKEYIPRNPVLTVTQCIPEMSEHEANTVAVTLSTKAMSHIEGGWPKDVDYTEAEHTIRYRKKMEKDEDYIRTVVKLGGVAEMLVKQNNAVDIYQQYFTHVTADHSAEVPSARTVTVFKDPSAVKRGVSMIDWHPDGSQKAVVSYSILQFQRQPAGMSNASYLWDLNNPNTPELELSPASQMCCAKFNLKDNNLIGGGLYNGQMCYFDVRKGGSPVDATPIEISHRDPLYHFAWLQSKTGTECMTVSTDGNVHWWDIRKLSECVESMPLREKNSETLLGGVVLEYDPQAGATKFLIGTEQGAVLSCNRKAKNPADRVASSFAAHHGPVYGLRRNPFNVKYFLSIGDWTARVWNEDLKTPLVNTKYHSTYLTGGTWSPTRPGVFFTIKLDGTLDVWDLLYKHNEPSLQLQVSDAPLSSLAVQDNGRVCAVGTADGSCTVLELSAGLAEMVTNEKLHINAMFDRETLREKNLDKALKEAKVKARKEAARKDELVGAVSEEQLRELEANFFQVTDPATAEAQAAAAAAAAPKSLAEYSSAVVLEDATAEQQEQEVAAEGEAAAAPAEGEAAVAAEGETVAAAEGETVAAAEGEEAAAAEGAGGEEAGAAPAEATADGDGAAADDAAPAAQASTGAADAEPVLAKEATPVPVAAPEAEAEEEQEGGADEAAATAAEGDDSTQPEAPADAPPAANEGDAQ